MFLDILCYGEKDVFSCNLFCVYGWVLNFFFVGFDMFFLVIF